MLLFCPVTFVFFVFVVDFTHKKTVFSFFLIFLFSGAKRMTLVSDDGAKYTGETGESGKREGRGEYIWLNGDRYLGDFTAGLKNGNGILYFSNGDKRVGVWKDDKLHGPATYYYSHGRIDEETWSDDNKISEKRRK